MTKNKKIPLAKRLNQLKPETDPLHSMFELSLEDYFKAFAYLLEDDYWLEQYLEKIAPKIESEKIPCLFTCIPHLIGHLHPADQYELLMSILIEPVVQSIRKERL